MKKINIYLLLLFTCLLKTGFTQNLVTFIPPDPNKGKNAAQHLKIDTIYTVLDAAKNYRRMVIIQNEVTIQEGYLIGKLKTGKWLNYTATGTLINLAEYDNGVKSGIYMEFDNGGALILQESYLNNKLDGEQKKYGVGPGGRVLRSNYSFKNGSYHGTCTDYTESGTMRSQMQYNEGKKDGTTKWYYTNGKLAMFQTYQNDLLNGPQELYNQQGVLTGDGDYLKNLKSGVWTEYYDNGKMKAKGNYTDDVKSGLWNYYDESGALTKTETF